MASNIIQFLSGKGFDHKGRTLNQVRALPSWRIEREHDVIQWMFPIDIPSKHFERAPVLTDVDIEEIKESVAIQDNLQLSLDRMIRFYSENDYWITQKNHNFLRITRILRCLWLAGRVHDYVCFQKQLDDIYIDYSDIIGEDSFSYWKAANDLEFLKNYKPTNRPPVKLPVSNDKTNPYDDDDHENWFQYT